MTTQNKTKQIIIHLFWFSPSPEASPENDRSAAFSLYADQQNQQDILHKNKRNGYCLLNSFT